MPKNKKLEDSSDSDSGPEDRNPAPSKKSKSEHSSSAKSSARTQDEIPTWKLDRNRLVKINEFRGRKMVDIREHYEKDGKTLPGKKGISLSKAEFEQILSLADEIKKELDN